MPRKRSATGKTATTATTATQVIDTPVTPVVETPATQTTQTNVVQTTHSNTKERKVMGLSAAEIQALLGATRTKGQYIGRLTEFIQSGVGAVRVDEEWPEFAGKNVNTVKQGFENAKNSKNAPEGVAEISVRKNDEKVYLLNMASDEIASAAA